MFYRTSFVSCSICMDEQYHTPRPGGQTTLPLDLNAHSLQHCALTQAISRELISIQYEACVPVTVLFQVVVEPCRKKVETLSLLG